MRGRFITFEGIDGAGKSSHIDAVAQAMRTKPGFDSRVVVTREPGGTELSEQLREMVIREPMDALTEALLVFAARREHVVRVIEPALAVGYTVLCDRFTDSSFAYQGAGREFSWETLTYLEQCVQDVSSLQHAGLPIHLGAQDILQPDLTILFDVAPEVAVQRLAHSRLPDKFESQDVAFFHRVSAGYNKRVSEMPQRFARIQADAPLAAVREQVLRVLGLRGYL